MNLAGAFLIALVAPGPGDDPAKDAINAFRKLYRRHPGLDARIEGVKALARHKDSRVGGYLARLLTGEQLEVRIVAARRLAAFRGVEGVGGDLSKAIRHPSNQKRSMRGVAVTILQAMGAVGGPEVLREINDRIGDRDPYIAKAAVISAGKLRHKSSIGPLVKSLVHLEGPSGRRLLPEGPFGDELPPTKLSDLIRQEGGKRGGVSATRRDLLADPIRQALVTITREEFSTAEDWDGWWRKHQRTFEVPK